MQSMVSIVLAARDAGTIRRIILNMECLLDNFLLFDRTMFDANHKDCKAILKLVTTTLKLSAFSIDDQIAHWKSFINYLVTLKSKAITEKVPDLRFNAYRFLLLTETFQEFIEDDSHESAVKLAHLISTRNLAPGGKSAMAKSLEKFKKTTSSAFIPDPKILGLLDSAVRRIAGICSHARGTSALSNGHCSLNSAGALDTPVSRGGKAAEAILDIKQFLNEIPESVEVTSYPWGERIYPAGLPRWQSWGRLRCPPGTKFLEILEKEAYGDREKLAGIGDHTGSMVFTVAYTMYAREKEKGIPIPIRQASVSEPGGKVRMITTGPWWLTVVQQPLAHMLNEHISYHPSANSVMMRTDQAWQSIRMFSRLKMTELPDTYGVLSSDLECATDAVPHSVGQTLLRGFLEALGQHDWMWLSEIGERTVFTEDYQVFTLQRGVMMGEPLSKTVLVLLSLCVEELAYSHYMGLSLRREYTKDAPWRCYHVGGDDHLAVGPLPYLNEITAHHRSLGSMISPEKHRISRVLVVYTEKVLHFTGKILNLTVQEVNRNPRTSIFVDSVKIRLLSPFTKALESVNDKNIAIGKVKGISRSLEWFGDRTTVRLVIDRALYKFRDYIAGPHHRTLRAVESLPITLGGLGLAQDTKYLANLPPIFNRALRSICSAGSAGYLAQRILGSIFQNSNPRGVAISDYVGRWAKSFVRDIAAYNVQSMVGWFLHIDPENHMSYRMKFTRLKEQGIVSLHEIPDIVERSYVFRRLLTDPPSGKQSFRTDPIRFRVAKAWKQLEDIPPGVLYPDDSPLNEGELQSAVDYSKNSLLINLNEEISINFCDAGVIPSGPWDTEARRMRIKDALSYGQPSMTIDRRHLTMM